jgi:hypothetical protein
MTTVLLWSAVARLRAPSIVGVLVVLLAGCWSAPAQTVQPREGRAGLQLAGSVEGRQLAVSDGSPQLNVGDCDPDATGDADVCVIAEDIDGQLVVLVFENPDVLQSGASLPVVDPACTDGCDDVADGVVVDLQVGTGQRLRARGGRVDVRRVEPFSSYVGDLRLDLASGSVSGSFDVIPRRDRSGG